MGKQFLMIHNIMEDPDSSTAAYLYCHAMPAFALLSIGLTLLQSVKSQPIPPVVAAILETSVECYFATEIVVRYVVCPKKSAFFNSPHNIIDIATSLPLILRAGIGFVFTQEDAEHFPIAILLYVVPVFRLLKMLRGLKKFKLLLFTALHVYLETMPVLLMLWFIALLFSSLIYWAEPRDNIGSYPRALWLTIVTMSTVA